MFHVKDFSYRPAEKAKLVQGVKGGGKPKDGKVVRGGNGSFIVTTPAKATLHLIDDESNEEANVDIAPALCKIAHQHNMKLTQSRTITVCSALIGTETKNGFIDYSTLEKVWQNNIEM